MALTSARRAGVLALSTLLFSACALASSDIRVTYAGSMGKVMDQSLGPAFAKVNHGGYQGQGQGAYGMARLLASKKITADVFVSITPGPMQILKDAGLIDDAVPVASTSMVIAYSPKSKFARQFAAASGKDAGSGSAFAGEFAGGAGESRGVVRFVLRIATTMQERLRLRSLLVLFYIQPPHR